MNGHSSQAFSEISTMLPSFYQSKALQTSGRGQTPYQGTIYVWDMKQQQFKYFLPSQGQIKQIAIAPDGRTLALIEAGGDNLDPKKKYSGYRLTVWDLPTGQLLRDVDIGPDSTSLPSTADSKTEIQQGLASLAFTADSKTLIAGIQDTTYYTDNGKTKNTPIPEISLWDVEKLRNP